MFAFFCFELQFIKYALPLLTMRVSLFISPLQFSSSKYCAVVATTVA